MRRTITSYADRNHRAALRIEPISLRLPDRGPGYFGDGRRERLVPPGRPTDLYGDVIVTVNRVRALEGAS